ncbi:DUF998 domain-containing protein [Arthrobacter sp. ISL-69]|uniref:DUF998 domain-containing protein n=1 Tax=Arthrobacter sp. ISL-69 TaxID=2819113 RepID=UPI001BE8CB19|nr:DUF998 domain-containing protein [Arthrobacter sp. ISL-69]MBT2535232.1 DUF998 domain-containing protein [Arthrobacter sp. ISL-69]
MTAATPATSIRAGFLPDIASTRLYFGAWAKLSVLQYFVAETAVIAAWAGPQPYDRRTGYISDLGAVHCGLYEGRDVCSPLHAVMNASFVVQGLGMLVGALLLSSALLCVAARPGVRLAFGPGHRVPWFAALAAKVLTFTAGAGTIIVGLVPEDAGWFAVHLTGALMYFIGGALALLLLGTLWLRQSPLGWFILACGAVSFGALVIGGVTGMEVPEPGTLERFMGYPVTIGLATTGLVIAQRVRQELKARKVRTAAQAIRTF